MYNFVYDKNGNIIKYIDDQGYIHDIDHKHKLEKMYKVGEKARYYKHYEDGTSYVITAITEQEYYYIQNKGKSEMKTAEELFNELGFYRKYKEDDTNIYIDYSDGYYENYDTDINFKISKIDNNHSIDLIQYSWPDLCESTLDLFKLLYPIIKQLEEYNIDIKDVYLREEKESKK